MCMPVNGSTTLLATHDDAAVVTWLEPPQFSTLLSSHEKNLGLPEACAAGSPPTLAQSAKLALPSPSVSYSAHASPVLNPLNPVSSQVHVRFASAIVHPARPPSFPALWQNSFRSF